MSDMEPGWYRDPAPATPSAPTTKRYWDGSQWTTQTKAASRRESSQWRTEIAEQRREYAAAQVMTQVAPEGVVPGVLTQDGSRDFTPDGERIAGWWSRGFAVTIDGILTTTLGVVLGWRYVTEIRDGFVAYVAEANQAMAAGAQPPPTDAMVAGLLPSFVALTAVLWGVKFVYNVGFLKAVQATPGKLLCGLEVRLREQPGTLSWGTVLARWFGQHVGGLVQALPVVGLVGTVYWLVNYLWPLWDPKRQALHDKVARTNVVRRGG